MIALQQTMLTTVDNPYDPFNEWDDWRAFDERAGYYTLAYLARVVATSDELSEADQAFVLDQAIDEIIEVNGSEVYKKITRNVEDSNKVSLP